MYLTPELGAFFQWIKLFSILYINLALLRYVLDSPPLT